MTETSPRSSSGPLVIRLEGPAVENHHISLRDLVLLGTHLQSAVDRIARILAGQRESARPGRIPSDIASCCTLELVALEQGSLALVCELPQRDQPTLFPDLGEESLSALVGGLAEMASGDGLPHGFDEGVLLAIRDSGKLLDRGIDQMSFELVTRQGSAKSTYTPSVHARVVQRIRKPIEGRRFVEGRLLMGDFKESAFRCRLHPPLGKPINCEFSEAQKDSVLSALTKYVRLFGEATEAKGAITSMIIEDIELLDAPSPDSQSESETSFFDADVDIASLASDQGVGAATSLDELAADFWPSEESVDDFLAAVEGWRKEEPAA